MNLLLVIYAMCNLLIEPNILKSKGTYQKKNGCGQ